MIPNTPTVPQVLFYVSLLFDCDDFLMVVLLSDIASGSSVDYAYNEIGIKMGFTFEFRDQGRYGFVLPSINILPNCQETVAAMIALVRESKKLGYL